MTGTSLLCEAMICLTVGDVGGGADEGKRDGVDAVVEAEFEIFAIFFGAAPGWRARCRED